MTCIPTCLTHGRQCKDIAIIEEQAAETKKLRDVVDALLQHEASSFFGPDEGKHKRASWRGVIRKARAALGETK
jgi:hypothetical protein